MLWYIYITIICLGILVGLVRWKSLPITLKLSLALLCWVLVIELLRRYSIPDSKEKNFLTHLNSPIELVLLFFYYYLLLSKKNRMFLYPVAFFYLITLITSSLLIPGYLFKNHNLDTVCLAICVTVCTVLFFLELIRKPIYYSLTSDGNFWINCAHILFYPGTLSVFGMRSYFSTFTSESFQNLSYINYTLNLLLYSLYIVAFCVSGRQKAVETGYTQ